MTSITTRRLTARSGHHLQRRKCWQAFVGSRSATQHQLPTSSTDQHSFRRKGNERKMAMRDAAEDDAMAMENAAQGKRRRRRLLSDVDRRVIIQRLEDGERQADLAREFGVTRAAICHINKHRSELLTRFDVFAETPRGRSILQQQQQHDQSTPAMENVTIVEPIDAARVLLTRLMDPLTDDDEAQRALRRLYRLVIEESRARINAAWFCGLLLPTTDSSPQDPLSIRGVACGTDAHEMLQLMQQLEPDVSLHTRDTSDQSQWRQNPPFAPSDAKCIIVMPICCEADELCRVIELTIEGISPSSICVACVGFVQSVVHRVQSKYPGVNVVAVTYGGADDKLLIELARRARLTNLSKRC